MKQSFIAEDGARTSILNCLKQRDETFTPLTYGSCQSCQWIRPTASCKDLNSICLIVSCGATSYWPVAGALFVEYAALS